VQQPFHGRPPELAGERLRGVRLTVTDAGAIRPYRVGVALLWVVHALHADRLVWNEAVLDRLTATPRLRSMLEAGRTPDEIAAGWADEVAQFTRRSAPYRLYD
jgi:uncharacterized protein YbbC (DUF1343 family)